MQLHQFYGEIWGRLIIIRILVQSVSSRTAYLAADKTWVQRPMKEKNDDDDDDDDDDGDDDDDDDDGDDDYITSEGGSKTGSRGSRPRLEAAQSFEKHENGPRGYFWSSDNKTQNESYKGSTLKHEKVFCSSP